MSEHEHEHEHEHEENPKESIIKIAITAALSLAAFLLSSFLNLPAWGVLLLWLAPYLLISYETYLEAFENIIHGEVFDENFLMCVAATGAMVLRDYKEAVLVMLLFQIGELFEGYAVGKSRRSIEQMMDIRPNTARVVRGEQTEAVAPEEVAIGEIIEIRPGERIPLDGVVLSGASSVDTSALTGESLPAAVEVGDDVLSGCVNLSGLLRVQVTKAFGQSTVSKVLELVQYAESKKTKSENFIRRFAKIYTPCVVGFAVLLAVVPGIITRDFAEWFRRACTFLVISCPCSLVISVPLTFFCGIGAVAKRGILLKGSAALDALAKTKTVVFDKTGTLTKGVFHVTAVHADKFDEQELLRLASAVESASNHPVARSIVSACPVDDLIVSDIQELVGRGMKGTVNDRTVCVGNDKLMDEMGLPWLPCHLVGTTVHVAVDGVYAGHIVASDEIKPEAKEALEALKQEGVGKTVMLTGDAEQIGQAVAEELQLDEVYTQLRPADKVERLESLRQAKENNTSLAFLGDGINDAPVLARADVGVAMGGVGSDAAIEAADAVLMDDDPRKFVLALRLARRTMGIVRQNIAFSLLVKFVVMALGLFGLAPMGLAVFADVGVTILVILNAMRALKTKNES